MSRRFDVAQDLDYSFGCQSVQEPYIIQPCNGRPRNQASCGMS
jgi:hypothetical protein